MILGVDPGEVHVGVSLWEEDPLICAQSREWTPEQYADYLLDGNLTKYSRVIIEGYWLEGGAGALRQVGSTFPTCELIGVTYHVARRAGVPFIKVNRSARAAARKRANAYGYAWRAHGYGDHAKDAEAVVIAGLKMSVKDLQ